MFRCSSDPSVEAVEGLWGREVGALLFQPLTHCLWGGNGAANSVLLCCTGCRAEGEPITETHRLPLSLTYLQQEQIVPTINIPNLLRASGAGEERIEPVWACAARHRCAGLLCKKTIPNSSNALSCFGYRGLWLRSGLGHHVNITILRVYAGASGVRLRGVTARRKPGAARPLPVVSPRL